MIPYIENADEKNYQIVCQGFVGQPCDITKDTCNKNSKLQCADWVNIDETVHRSTGHKCKESNLCNQPWKDPDANINYDIVCNGTIEEHCKTVGEPDSCNTEFKYTCADWVNQGTHQSLNQPMCQDPVNCG